MKYATGEEVRVGDVVETATIPEVTIVSLGTWNGQDSAEVSIPGKKHGGSIWPGATKIKLLRRAPTPTHYASGEDVRIGDVVMVDTDTGKCAIIERIDATGLSGRYSGSNDAWTARDAGGVRLMKRGATPEAKPMKTIGHLFRATPEERAAWVAGKKSESKTCTCREVRHGVTGAALGVAVDPGCPMHEVGRRQMTTDNIKRPDPSAGTTEGTYRIPAGGVLPSEQGQSLREYAAKLYNELEAATKKPDPYAHTAEREEEIYRKQILRDTFGDECDEGAWCTLDVAMKDEKLPAKLRAAIAMWVRDDDGYERAAEILNPRGKR